MRWERGTNLAIVFAAVTAKGDGAPCRPGSQPVRFKESFPSAMESTRA